MRNLNLKQWACICISTYCIMRMIYIDATTTVENMSAVNSDFSFGNLRPLTWIIPIFVWVNSTFPIIKHVDGNIISWRWSIYPVNKNSISRLLGIIFSIYDLWMLYIMIIFSTCLPLKGYDSRDYQITQIHLFIGGILLMFLNILYYRKSTIIDLNSKI